jgi:ribonuclease HI
VLKVITDGSGNGRCAFVVYDSQGNQIKSQVIVLGSCTNNVAEYQGLIHALEYLWKHHRSEPALVISGSQLVVRQLLGQYQVRAATLVPLHQRANSLLKVLPKVRIEWKDRSHVSVADNLMR